EEYYSNHGFARTSSLRRGKQMESTRVIPTINNSKTSKQILSVSIKHLIDESPDTSHLGEYSNHADSDYTIDRKHAEDCPSFFYGSDECSESCSADNVPRGELRFFNPS